MPLDNQSVMYAAMLALTKQNVAHKGELITIGKFNGILLSGYVIDPPIIIGEFTAIEPEEEEGENTE